MERLEEFHPLLKGRPVESLIGGGRDAVTFHEYLGEVLGSFQHGSRLGRTDDRDTGCTHIVLEGIIDALHQRILRPHDNHVHLSFHGEVLEPAEIVCTDRHILTDSPRTGIAGCDEELTTVRTLCDLPCQGVLAAAAT